MDNQIVAHSDSERERNCQRIKDLRYFTFMLRRASYRIFLSIMLIICDSIEDETSVHKCLRRLTWLNDGEDEIVFPSANLQSSDLDDELTMAEKSLCFEFERWETDAAVIQTILNAAEDNHHHLIGPFAKFLHQHLLKKVKSETLCEPGISRWLETDMDELVFKVDSLIRISSYEILERF